VEFRQAVAETGPFGRRCLSILPCSPFSTPRSSNRTSVACLTVRSWFLAAIFFVAGVWL
jgi:hypothetical protein